jgi:hypothetical protein
MRHDVATRLEFMRIQIRNAERAFMGGGYIHATHDELDRFQIFFSSHPSVLNAIKDVRVAISEFLTTKINGRLEGEQGHSHPVAVWHSYHRLEQVIAVISVADPAQDAISRPRPRAVAAA